MHQWLLQQSMFEKVLDLSFVFFVIYNPRFHFYDFLCFIFLLLLAYYRRCPLVGIENQHGKWFLHYPQRSIELESLRICLDSKYALICLAKRFDNGSKRLIILFFDQFQYEDEAYLRYFLKAD